MKRSNFIRGIFFICICALISSIAVAKNSYGESENDIPLAPGAVTTRSVCGGTIDWQDVEMYNGALGPTINFVNTHQGAVGQIRWNSNLRNKYNKPGNVNDRRWCTGTLIGENLFLTAGHCFDNVNDKGWIMPVDNVTGKNISSAEIATNMHVEFDYQRDSNGNLRNTESFDVVELVEYRLGGLDYAILRLDGNPDRSYPTATLSANVPYLNDSLTIIQHPAGIPKVVEAGPCNSVGTTEFTYRDLDTKGGSSGSGVLNSEGQVVGVHIQAGCSSTGGANTGVLMSAIVKVSPEVQKRIPGYVSSTMVPVVDLILSY